MVQDLRDAIIREHSKEVDLRAGRENWVWRGWAAARWRIERGPGFGNKDLGAFPEVYWRRRLVEKDKERETSHTFVPVNPCLVPKGREGFHDHLDQVKGCAVTVVLLLEGLDEV